MNDEKPAESAPARESAAEAARDEIQRRAYAFYLERGGADGSALQDWLRAERQVLGRLEAGDEPPPE